MCLAFSQADQLDGKLEFSRADTASWSRREPKSGADGEGVGLGVGMGVVWGGPGGVGGARAGVGVTECQLTIVAKLLVEVRRWLLCCFNLPFSAGIHSSVLDGICTLREAHMRSTPSLKSFSNVGFEASSNLGLFDDVKDLSRKMPNTFSFYTRVCLSI